MQDCGVGILKYKGQELQFVKSLLYWLFLSLGAAMVSRLAKNLFYKYCHTAYRC